jgi:hypothetical protein
MGRRHAVRPGLGENRCRASTTCSSAFLLQAEVLELKAPREAFAKGVVIESRLDKGRGPGRNRARAILEH